MFVEHKEQGEVKALDEPAKLLLKAAGWLEKHGLCQRNANSEGRGKDGSGCVIYALYQVGADWPNGQEAQNRVMRAVGLDSVVTYVERSGATQSEVIAKLRAVALGL